MSRSCFLILYILWSNTNVLAQSDIPIGSWRTHNSYNSLKAISISDSKIYAASGNAVFDFNPANQELSTITSLSGLNDTDITAIDYNIGTDELIIAYKNGNIDMLQDNKIKNFSDLLRADINGSKEIHHIFNYQQYSYLSTDFGVMIIDLDNMQVKETLFELGPQGQTIIIYASTITSDTLYLATEIGVMRGSLQDNLKDFNQWQLFDASDGLPQSLTKIILATPTGLLTAIDNTGIFEYDGNIWQNKNLLNQSLFRHASQSGNETLFTTTDTVYQYSLGKVSPVVTDIGKEPKASLVFADIIWLADGRNGLVSPEQGLSIYPSGPYSNEIINLYNFKNKVVATPAAYDSFFQPLLNSDGFFLFEDGVWNNFNSTGNPHTSLIPEFYDITGAVYSTIDKSLYLSSFGYGILRWNEQSSEIINENNSSLINLNPPNRNVLITAIGGSGDKLSVINFTAFEPLHLYDIVSDLWQPFTPSTPATYTTQIIDLGNGTYWMKIAPSFGGGIKVYDAVNLRELYLTSADLPDNEVNDMALDRDGKMWIATEKGVVYFHNAANILDFGNVDPVFPIFDGQILFKDENITALAVDGGNRIWMGTSSGLWLFDNDGQTEVSHFQADNSPIPSNNILDITINQSNGEVFVATANGLVSYRGTSTLAGQFDEVKIFPNPVLTYKNDLVTIEGVPENADLWITDASGRLVFKTQANGNTAIWQGLSSNQSLSSGVYFVFIANEDGTEKQVGKVAIIN